MNDQPADPDSSPQQPQSQPPPAIGERADPEPVIRENEDAVTIAACDSEFAADHLVVLLESEGIPARALPTGTMGRSVNPTAQPQGVIVQVPASAANQATAVLAAAQQQQATPINWDEVDVGAREDDLPLRRPGRMPLAAKVGFIAAAGLLGLTLLMILIAQFL